jgi:hypothetical protein
MTDVSIVIVNWNTRELLRQCLRSVASQAGPLSLELFVVDNGSSDGSPEMVKREFPHVNLIENQHNLGFARACNQALRQARGKAAMLLNSDAQLLPGSLQTLYGHLNQRLNYGAVGAQLVDEDGSLQNAVDHFPTLITELGNKSLLKILFPTWYPGKRSGFTEPVEVPSLIGAAMMVRREVLEKVGLLDEEYFFFMEETDWCYRMRQQGWKIIHLPHARILHLGGRTAKKFSWRSKVEYYRSRYLFFRKHRSRLATAILAAGLFLKIIFGLSANGLGALLAFGKAEKLRKRCRQYWSLLVWHLKGCPDGMGLAAEGNVS